MRAGALRIVIEQSWWCASENTEVAVRLTEMETWLRELVLSDVGGCIDSLASCSLGSCGSVSSWP